MSGNVLNGDQLCIRFGSSYMFYNKNYNVNGEWAFVFSETDALYFSIIKMQWTNPGKSACSSGHDCGSVSEVAAGTPIYYGDLVSFYNYNNTSSTAYSGYLSTSCSGNVANDHKTPILSSYGPGKSNTPGKYSLMNVQNCAPATNNASNGQFTMCESDDIRSCGIWCIVSFDGIGYMSDSHLQNFGPASEADNPNSSVVKTPVRYSDTFYLQCIFDQNCDVGNLFNIDNSSDVYLYCESLDQGSITSAGYLGYAMCDSMNHGSDFPDVKQHYGYALNFLQSCSYTEVCSSTCNSVALPVGSPIKSGDEICIYSACTNLPAAVGGSYTLTFDDQNQYTPGQRQITFCVKKLNMQASSFYTNDDPDAAIKIGDPFAMFGRDTNGDVGLVYTADLVEGANNIIIKTDSTQWNTDNGCGNDGFFFSTWVFVQVNSDCLGNCSDGNIANTTNNPTCVFGRSYYIESFGKTACFHLPLNPLSMKNIINNTFWTTGGQLLQTNTPNLNCSRVNFSCPNINDTTWRFYITNSSGRISCSNPSECQVNNCVNCLKDCSQANGCCGCTTGYSFGSGLTKLFGWSVDVLKWIGIVILAIILIIVIILILVGIISAISKSKSNKDKNKKNT